MIKADQYLEVLVGLDLFRSFSKNGLKARLNSSGYDVKQYEKDQIIHLQNEVCRSMDIILDGKVAVQKIDEDGNVLTINVFSAPEVIGAHLIFSTHNIYPMTVIAESKVVTMCLNRELTVELGQSDPDFMVALLQIISDRIMILADKIRTISHNTIREQITAFLTYEYYIQQSQVIKLNFSKKELAERLGVQRTSLSRELNKMRRDGLLEYDARTITINKAFEIASNHKQGRV
jgi:CRP/FNR family transcriptional regulator, dissimilatory nitrate respiration regulator